MEVYSLKNIIQMIGIEYKYLELLIESFNNLSHGKKYILNPLINHYLHYSQSKDRKELLYMDQIKRNICF